MVDSMCVEGLKRSLDKPSNNVLGEGAMKGKVKKKSENNLAKSSTSLCRGGCRGQKSNHLEEQTKLAGQSAVGLLASEQHRRHQTALLPDILKIPR